MIYQVIKHEYDSDDGHYDSDPVDDLVYANEADAILVRNGLNKYSIFEYNTMIRRHAERRDDRDKYLEKALCKFDPTDVDAIENWAGRSHSLTYFTINTLRLFK